MKQPIILFYAHENTFLGVTDQIAGPRFNPLQSCSEVLALREYILLYLKGTPLILHMRISSLVTGSTTCQSSVALGGALSSPAWHLKDI